MQAFSIVDVETDINAVTAYFSYEHFYVLYCKFWELDTDHDFYLSRGDLGKISHVVPSALDRVYAQAGRPFVGSKGGQAAAAGGAAGAPTPAGGAGKTGPDGRPMMGYEDFCAFFLASEDKTHSSSLRYWFNVADMDGDGVLTAADLRHFWPDQAKRFAEARAEAFKFEDILCQFHDLLQPGQPRGTPGALTLPPGYAERKEGVIRFADFTHPSHCKLSGVFFSALWDADKFLRYV